MADRETRWPDNAQGRFYVDDKCIDCDLCRTTAPESFARSDDGYSFVAHQPGSPRDEAAVRQALAECPVEAIGDDGAV